MIDLFTALFNHVYLKGIGLVSFFQEKEDGTQPAEPRSFDMWPAFINMLVVLALVVGLILVIAWVARKFTGKQFAIGSSGFMELVSTIPLGDKKFVSILRVGKKYILLGITGSQISNLGELQNEEVENEIMKGHTDGEGSFAKLLKRFRGESGEAKN